MKVRSVEAIVRALNDAAIDYLVAGGLAVNAHGYGRATFDVDLVVRLTPETVQRLFEALGSLGYLPLVPIRAEQFGDDRQRETFIREKGMVVLQFYSDDHRETRVDIFAREPFDFDEELHRAYVEEVAPGVPVRFVALKTLIRMKREAGRPQDLDDLRHLSWIEEDIRDGEE